MPAPGKSDLLPPSKSGTSIRHHRASPICHHRVNSELQCATTGQGQSTKEIADLPKEKEVGASLMRKIRAQIKMRASPSPGMPFACTSAPIVYFGALARLSPSNPHQWHGCSRKNRANPFSRSEMISHLRPVFQVLLQSTWIYENFYKLFRHYGSVINDAS